MLVQRFTPVLFLAVVFVPVARSAADDEACNLRGGAPEKGQVFVLTGKSSGKDLTRRVVGERTEKFDETGSVKKEFDVLAVSGGQITRLRTKVLEDHRVEIFRGRRKELKKAHDRDLAGHFVFSERTKNGWKNSLEDFKPDEKQKRALKDFVPFREDDVLLPAEKVKVGHIWKLEQSAFDKIFGTQFEEMRATGTGKFLRVEKVDGEDLAVIEIEFTMTGKSKEDEITLEMEMKTKNVAFRSLKYGIDRKSTQVTSTSMKGFGEIEGEKHQFEFNGTTSWDETVDVKSK